MKLISTLEAWIQQSVFFYPLLLSLISAAMFYYFFTLLPQKRQKKNIKDHVIYLTERILHHMMFIIQDSVNSKIEQSKIRSFPLSESELKTAMTDVFMDDQLKHLRSNKDGVPMKVGEAVVGHVHALQQHAEVLFRYIFHLDTDLVRLINEGLRNHINESFVNSYNMKPLRVGNTVLAPVRSDVSGYAKSLCEYHRIYRELEQWLFKNYPNHKAVLRRRYFHYFHDHAQFAKGVRIARKLSNSHEHKKEATLFMIKGYVAMGKVKKAKALKRKAVRRQLVTETDIKNAFKNDRKFSSAHYEKIR